MAWRRITRSFVSLKARATVSMIALLFAGVGSITLLLMNRVEHDALKDLRNRELTEAVRTAMLLSRAMVDLQQALSLAEPQITIDTLWNFNELRQFIETKTLLRSLFSSVFIARSDGQVLIITDTKGTRRPTAFLGDREYFQATIHEARPLFSPPISGRLTGEPVIVLTQPLRNAQGVYGVLGGGLSLTRRDLLANVVDQQDSDDNTLRVVTDKFGIVIAHPNQSRLLKSLSEEPRLAQAFAAWLAAGQPVEPSGIQLPQANELVSAAGVPGPDWMVWRVRPESELLTPLHAARREALVRALVLIAIMSLLTLTFLYWLLRPLGLLEQRAKHMFDRRYPAAEGWPDAVGEIGELKEVLKQVGMQRLQLEAKHDELLKRLESVLSASPVGFAFTRHRTFVLVSQELCRLLSKSEAELLSASTQSIYANPDDQARIEQQALSAFRAGQSYVGDWELRRGTRDSSDKGSTFWAQMRASPVDANNAAAGTIWTVTDISDQRKKHQALEWSAGHDSLTKLANRRTFEQEAAALVHPLSGRHDAAIIYIDLDHFKPVNDLGGHAAGDAMLIAVAHAIHTAVRASDLVARWGGDEFAVLLNHCDATAALRIARNILAAISGVSIEREQQHFSVGASLGVANLYPDLQTLSAWLAEADLACYEAKAAGRGTIRSSPQRTPAATGGAAHRDSRY
ncbi:diguanylate cyclase [Roseateles koreensis]|uniref:Diguanylate cyclase n=1 Tax=Roseateles koreensis TaxID=2987526 RepID=A0ABT5KSL3_9BURK|nr:diguanylate cyclase [Roseateles koreensis]MDC8785927.1 diguanylate cyclase [Roseateles koreensis]